jgi:cytochrome c peroxidase
MKLNILGIASIIIGFFFVFTACIGKKTPMNPTTDDGDLTDIPYNPQAYTIQKPNHYPQIAIPIDNPMTVAGVQLGRKLFYDAILSGDSSQSCSSCHLPSGSFTDNKKVAIGIDGIAGHRSSMSLMNVAYVRGTKDSMGIIKGLFWDGRAETLESQALLPVEDPIEMHNTWSNAIGKLKNHDHYPEDFRKAFGITNKSEITKELAAKAIAQFERILIGSGKSKYDLWQTGDGQLTDEEEDGRIIYFDEANDVGVNLPDGQCFHCHGGITLSGSQFFNNGLDEVASLTDFADLGRGIITKNPEHNGQFRSPTLRNIAMTAPYMHDGRFSTLEEVLNHYGTHGKSSQNKDRFIDQIGFIILGSNPVKYKNLSLEHQQSVIKFLHTLTDNDFVNNPDIKSPF